MVEVGVPVLDGVLDDVEVLVGVLDDVWVGVDDNDEVPEPVLEAERFGVEEHDICCVVGLLVK